MDNKQPRVRGGGKDKVKNEEAKGNRRVLSDIGNLEPLITRPITRGLRAKLLANAQVAAVDNKNLVGGKLPVNRRGGGGNAKKVAHPSKKLSEKPNPPDDVVDISSDDGEEMVERKGGKKQTSDEVKPDVDENVILLSSNDQESANPVSERRSTERPLRRNVKTLTSILTARSKAACGVVENEQKDQIADIDAADINDELAVVEYVDDLYKFYKSSENDTRVNDYISSQPFINVSMRKVVVDWLIEAHNAFQLMPETLFLTINVLDRCLSMKIIQRGYELQLVGLGCMLIACKYEEVWPPQVRDLVSISRNAYVEEQILAMEKSILEKLEWYLTVPTPYVFLVRYIKASASADMEMENMVFFLAELGLMHYDTIVLYPPSMIAAAAVYAARCTLNRSPFWSATLKHHTGYSEEELMKCAKLLVAFHLDIAKGELNGIWSKYCNPCRDCVALLPPAKILLDSPHDMKSCA